MWRSCLRAEGIRPAGTPAVGRTLAFRGPWPHWQVPRQHYYLRLRLSTSPDLKWYNEVQSNSHHPLSMTSTSRDDITDLLLEWGKGDKAALDKLVQLVHQDLRRLARHYLREERPDHTLQTTALVNEAYLRLVHYEKMKWQNRAHFLAVAAQAMRRILVEHARSHLYAKRGGGAQKVSIEDAPILGRAAPADIVALDDALDALEAFDPRKCRIVELKFIGGLSIEETAEVLAISTATVEREWRSAKAWLYQAMTEGKA